METTSGRTTRSPPHPCDITPDSQCTADNGFHAVCFSNLLQPQVDAMRWSFTNDYDPIPYVATSEGACDGNEDVRVVDRYDQGGAWGHTECEPSPDYGGVDPLGGAKRSCSSTTRRTNRSGIRPIEGASSPATNWATRSVCAIALVLPGV